LRTGNASANTGAASLFEQQAGIGAAAGGGGATDSAGAPQQDGDSSGESSIASDSSPEVAGKQQPGAPSAEGAPPQQTFINNGQTKPRQIAGLPITSRRAHSAAARRAAGPLRAWRKVIALFRIVWSMNPSGRPLESSTTATGAAWLRHLGEPLGEAITDSHPCPSVCIRG